MKAVIFDLDGCLADSEVLCLTAIAEVLTGYGIPDMTWQVIRDRFLGQSLRDISAALGGVPESFPLDFETRVRPIYEAHLKPMQGALRLVTALRSRGVPMAIATGGSPRRMGFTLRIAGLAGFFQGRGFSAEDVPRGKPHPDLFLHAAARLGVAPEDCIVVEDSPHGILGAARAGMYPLGFTGGSHLVGLTEPHAAKLFEAGAEEVHDTLPQEAILRLL